MVQIKMDRQTNKIQVRQSERKRKTCQHDVSGERYEMIIFLMRIRLVVKSKNICTKKLRVQYQAKWSQSEERMGRY